MGWCLWWECRAQVCATKHILLKVPHTHSPAPPLRPQALQFQRSLDDMEEWLSSVEKEVSSKDCGTDLASVIRLLKALHDLEEVVDGHLERLQALVGTAKDFSAQGNFLAKEIQQRVQGTVNRSLTLKTLVLVLEFISNPTVGY